MPTMLAGATLVLAAATVLLLLLRRKVVSGDPLVVGRLEQVERGQERVERSLREEMARGREEAAARSRLDREDAATQGKQLREEVSLAVRLLGETLSRQADSLSAATEARHETLRKTVEERLRGLQQDNATRLDQMRQTVDEKLSGTLEKRLGDSFALVGDRLEQVHRGLGEMQALAAGVGDLKKVLGNVKTRGTWGEVLLGNLLEQVLAPEQFERNATTREGGAERVEFAIRLPGRDDDSAVLLPIDSKFPREDWERLLEAAERGDAEGVEDAGRALEARVRLCAREIRDKYVNPPRTTDFAILFLPTESLYAEVLRRPGLVEALQREHRIVVAGPTTLAALLNSLQMGFRTLAIQKRSAEVWEVLGAVKTEFSKFGDVLAAVRKRLDQASSEIESVGRRSRAIERKLRDVGALPATQTPAVLDAAAPPDEDEKSGDDA